MLTEDGCLKFSHVENHNFCQNIDYEASSLLTQIIKPSSEYT